MCKFCGRGCAKPSVLEKHLRAHTGERPYPCVPCGFAFKTKSNLYKHCKSRAHALRVAGSGESTEQYDAMEEEEDEDHCVVEVVQRQNTLETNQVEQVEKIDKDAKKKELKYYIVEVKEGDSIEEVVKKARLAAGTDKVEMLTQQSKADDVQEVSRITQAESVVVQPEIVEEVGSFDEGWQEVHGAVEEPEQVSADEVTVIGHSTHRLTDKTMKLEIHLAPTTSSSKISQADVISTTPSAKTQETRSHEYSVLPVVGTHQTSTPLQMKSQNPTLSSVTLSAQGQPNLTPAKPQTPKTPQMRNPTLTPEMLTARISELITKNQAIVNTPMADAPRPKRMSRQSSEVRSAPLPTSAPVSKPSGKGQLFIQGM